MNPPSSSIDKKSYAVVAQSANEAAPPAYEAEDLGTLIVQTERLTVQPVLTPQMSIGGSRNPTQLEIGMDGKRSWNHGLCSCHEAPGQTAIACCCPCFLYSSNQSRLQHLGQTGAPNPSPKQFGLTCCLYMLSPQLFGVGQIAMQCFSRFQTRQRYGIRGDLVQDTLVGAFCVPCTLVQESREIEEEELALQQGGQAPETFYRDEEVVVVVGEQAV